MTSFLAATWQSWWFPGLGNFLDMIAFAFWWTLAVVIGAAPVLLMLVILYIMVVAWG